MKCKLFVSLALVAVLTTPGAQASESNLVIGDPRIITWTFPKTVKIPNSGCTTFGADFVWGDLGKLAMVSLKSANREKVSEAVFLKDGSPLFGNRTFKLCREAWTTDDGYAMAGVSPGRYLLELSGGGYGSGFIDIEPADLPNVTAKTGKYKLEVFSPSKSTWAVRIRNAKGLEVTVNVGGSDTTNSKYYKFKIKSSNQVLSKAWPSGSGRTVLVSVRVGKEWILFNDRLLLR